MKYMMVISYDGSKFHGFQRQKDVRNVQGYLESTLKDILGEEILVKGSGRTDAGVHAKGQVIHFETNNRINGLKGRLNSVLKDCQIKRIVPVKDVFHARYSVKSKIYLYKIDLSGKKNSDYYLNFKYKLNIREMKKAARELIGYHDFKNFVAGYRDDYTSTITSIKIYRIGKTLYLKFKGIGFYRYMVRNLVGALLDVGRGKVGIDYLRSMLDTEEEKRLTTVSPNGLYLMKINYKKNEI